MSSDRPSSDSGSKDSPTAPGSTERPAIGRELQPTIDSSSQGVYSNPTIAQPQASTASNSNPASVSRTHLTAPGDFGKYKLLKVLGQGGMGAVYMADDPTLDRKVALKIPLVDPQERSAILDRFKREAKAVAPLRHPSICPVFEVGEIDGRPYMTMAYIEGKPLSDFIDPKKPLPIKSALTMTAKIAAALDYAHKKGVIHRDLKPANIMIDERREPVIMDFGLARRSSHPQETKLTQAGSVMGTPAYMPPEQARGDAEQMGPASDIYSLGVILFEMLSGRVPFEGDLFSVMIKLGTDAPPALPSLRSNIDPAVDAICQKALAKSPQDRYASMADFGKAISAYLKQLTSTGSSVQTVRESSSFSSELPAPKTTIASAPAIVPPVVAPAELPTSSRSRWLYPVLGLTILTMGAAGAWVIVRDKSGNEVAKIRVPDDGNVTIETKPHDVVSKPPTSAESSEAPPIAKAPFSAAEAKQFQEAWGKHLNRPVEMTNSIGMKFMLIPPGEFVMGTSQEDADSLIAKVNEADIRKKVASEVPPHKVRITKPFYMQTTEVTLGQFRKFIDSTGYKTEGEKVGKGGVGASPGDNKSLQPPELIWNNAQVSPTDNHPVASVSWNDATEFAKWLGKTDGKFYCLPTEAQWEYCCRSGTETLWFSGTKDARLAEYAWYERNNAGSAQPVGLKKPNAFGLFDLHGNVREWCADRAEERYYAHSPVDDPPGPDAGSSRILRGGDFRCNPSHIRSNLRTWYVSTTRDRYLGFRLSIDISKTTETSATNSPTIDPKPETNSTAPSTTPPMLVAPFTESTANASQEAWSKHLNRPVKEKNSIGMELMLIPPGEFTMGTSPEDAEKLIAADPRNAEWQKKVSSEIPPHKVRITNPFYMQTTEVTLGQFRKFVDATGYKTQGERDGKGGVGPVPGEKYHVYRPEFIWSNRQFSPTDDHPVVFVSWNDASVFAKWLSKTEGKSYRLPTEAQWEYCCRSGTETWWFSGANEAGLADYAWYARSTDNQQPVGRKKPNAFGLFDLHGNVWEWCSDRANESYYARSPTDDPLGSNDGAFRVRRGGTFVDRSLHVRSSSRSWQTPESRLRSDGFRLSIDISKTTETAATNSPTIDPKPETNTTAPSTTPPMLVAPFTELTAKASQEVWSKQLNRPVKEKNSVGMEFMLIPPGEFMMGTSQADADTLIAADPNNPDWRVKVTAEVPAHKVRITKPFYMHTTETTVGQFRKFVMATGYKSEAEKDGIGGAGPVPGEKNYLRRPEFIWSNTQFSPTDEHPVVLVSWNDAMEFVKWLSVTEGKTYRLPTEAQWEYCCRSGTETLRFGGNDPAALADYAWYSTKNYAQPVGGKKPNAFGLFDMNGNVDEWCADWANPQYYASSPIDDPPGPPAGSARILRGSHFAKGPLNARSARRYWDAPTQRIIYNGFRVVLDIANPAETATSSSSAPPLLVAPFPESTAKASQEAWSRHLNRPVKEKNSIGMELMLIPPGEFMMGIADDELEFATAHYAKMAKPSDSKSKETALPRHKVRITRPFYMQTTETTVGQFRRFVEATGYKTEGEKSGKGGAGPVPGESDWKQRPEYIWSNPQFSPTDEYPVVFVTWNDATAFATWLSDTEGKIYKLPTEAQWEYCCRSGTETWWYSGNTEAGLGDYAWYSVNGSAGTHPVGQKKANAFGLFDLHGNVFEWCADWGDSQYYSVSPTDDPPGPATGKSRVLRGGAYKLGSVSSRSSRRDWYAPTDRIRYSGFRLTIDLTKNANLPQQ